MITKTRVASLPAFHHVNIKTSRLAEMVDWYCSTLHCTVSFRGPEIAFLTNDAANHRIALAAFPGLTDDPDKFAHTGMLHSAFEYESLDDLLSEFLRLEDMGILPHATVDHGLTTSFYYADPDSNSVELQVDNFGDWAKSKEWMRTSKEFLADQIGPFVDPHKMIADRNAGISIEEVHRKAYAGQYPAERAQTFFLPGEVEQGIIS